MASQPTFDALRGVRVALLGCSLLVLPVIARADHFSGAGITYDCLGSNQYRVYLDLYLDCAGAPIIPQTLYFSNDCGVSFTIANLVVMSSVEVSPLCASQLANSTCNGGAQPGFRKYRFQTTLFLSPCNKWTIEWYTCCRNTTQNINGTPGTYVVATLNNLGGLSDDSPVFVDSGIPYVCVGQPVLYNPGASDPDGDAMSFALISARFAAPLPTNCSYQGGFTGASPFTGITISPANGQLSFTPVTTGYYVVVIEVSSYTSGGVLIGRVMRDLMFSVIVCDGTPPATTGIAGSSGGASFMPGLVFACTGLSFCVSIPFTDQQAGSQVTISSNASVVLPGSTFSVSGTNPAIATICWTGNISLLPQSIWLQASDGACPIANTMSTSITVVDCILLPVELLSFMATPDVSAVRVEWSTGSESGSDHFNVERSLDGSAFTSIGTVRAAGNSQQLRHYIFFDPTPLAGTSYYRLKEVDNDGSVSYSEMVAVRRMNGILLQATTYGTGQWVVGGAPAQATWQMLDLQGATISTGRFADAANNSITVPRDAHGMHLLVVESDGQRSLLKLPPVSEGEYVAVGIDGR